MAKLRLFTTRIGDTLHIHDEESRPAVEANIKPDGHGAVRGDGSREWIIDEVVCDASEAGAARFTWDKTGNRVKHARTRYKQDAGGAITKTVERFIYKAME